MSPSTRDGDLVSVVIPARNADAFVGEAIESVLAQTYSPVEVVVVDDGSEDATFERSRAFGDRVRAVSQPPAGVAAAVNRGVALARGGLLAFIDADDLWTRDKLETQAAALREEPRLDAVFGHAQNFVGDPSTPSRSPEPLYSRGTMLVRRAAFDAVGGFSGEWRLGEFVDWYARAVDGGLEATMLAHVVLLRRVHGDNLGVRLRGEQAEYARVLKAVLDRRRREPQP